jgi:monoamine oxidase
MTLDAIVVGAGISGLACARRLVEAGLTTMVIEARNRVGGRIQTLRLPGEPPIELGAQVVHGDRAATWSLIQAAGLQTTAVAQNGEMLFRVAGRTWTVSDVNAARCPLPWLVEQRVLSGQPNDESVEEVVERLEHRTVGKALALDWLGQTWCADPAKLSAAGMKRVRECSTAGEGEFRLDDGYDALPREMARNLDIHLERPVQSIRWRPGEVVVTAAHESFQARAAVVTVPPTVIAGGGILFDPPLSEDKMEAARAIRYGAALVVVARLSRPAPRSSWVLNVDGGIWRAETGSKLLRGWVKGRLIRPRSAAELTARAFPWLRADDIESLYVADWSDDPFTRGGYSYPTVGALDAPQRWAAPVAGSLFFGGEATAQIGHLGLVHGAIESGWRAAAELGYFCA